MSEDNEFNRRMRAMTESTEWLSKLKNVVAKQPLELIHWTQSAYTETEDGYHDALRIHITSAYMFGLNVYNSRALRRKFFAEPFFAQERRRKRRKNTLRLVMKFMTNARKGNRYKRGNVYAKALEKVLR